VIITLDGYRWEDVFRGADSYLLNKKEFNSQDSLARLKKYWADDVSLRRQKLMPFFWNYVSKNGIRTVRIFHCCSWVGMFGMTLQTGKRI
jgi:hypothetical protein